MKTVKLGRLEVGKKPVLLCTVVERDLAASLRAASESMALGADGIELRLDKLRSDRLVPDVVGQVKAPKLVVCRPRHLDGFFRGTEGERIERMLLGLESGADAIDVELTTARRLRQRVIDAVKARPIPLLVCYENFVRTPSSARLLEILREEAALGADIAKVAVMARSHADLITVLQTILVARLRLTIPFAAIAMGRYGSISRPLSCLLGASITYCARSRKKLGGPGQLPVADTRAVIDLLS